MSQVHIIVDEYQNALGESPWYIPRYGYTKKDRANEELVKHRKIKKRNKKKSTGDDQSIQSYVDSHIVSVEIIE
jgi:hypothetical protein